MTDLAAAMRSGVQWRPSGTTPHTRATPLETPVALSFDGRPHTVLMATPRDVHDLAIGFTLTEAIATMADIVAVDIKTVALGIMVDVRLAPGAADRKARPRTLEGRSSCGLCGVQRLADVVRPLPPVPEGEHFRHRAVQRAIDALADHQPLGRQTRAAHAAAFASREGEILVAREDVGRHSALDKLAGAMAREQIEAARGFVLVTSRCSFEMVEKTVRLGASVLVAVSAPTELAIAKAEKAGLTLVALARADGHTVFTRADRLVDDIAELVHG